MITWVLFLAAAAAAAAAGGTEAGMPAAGAKAPEFKLADDRGGQTALADYRGKWVVLYFYPKDFTSGCTVEAHNFQRDLAQYEKRNAVILGVSTDSAESHKGFCEKEGLKFKLLADTGGATSLAYGSIMEHEGTKYSARNTFLIDPDGKIARVFSGVKPAAHSEEVLAALDKLKTPS